MLVDSASLALGLSSSFLDKVARTASHRYKTYQIRKTTGKLRTIHHPSKELKLIQSWLSETIFEKYLVHDSAYAYRKGRNVRQNATCHADKRYLLRVDFKDFFPSIRACDIARLLENDSCGALEQFTSSDVAFILAIVCKDGRLTIGAPSSPSISNAVMFEFDSHWATWHPDLTYTRYADDLFFSTNTSNLLSSIYEDVKKYLNELSSPRFHINEEKTTFTSRKRRMRITGLTLTSDGRVSLGRKKKRHIKGMIYRFTMHQLSLEEAAHLNGLLAYCNSVDPEFCLTLVRKFGSTVLETLKS